MRHSRNWLLLSCVLASFIFFLLATFLPALSTLRHGFPTYYVAARLVWEGRWSPQVYDDAWFLDQVRTYTPNGIGEIFAPNPPSTALLMLPLAGLDLTTARQVWLWVSLALLLATVALLARRVPAGQPWARVAVVALPFLFAPLHENFRLANVYGLLLCLFTVALVGQGRVASIGAALGLAAGTKLSGSPLWVLLAARGRWRDLAVAASVALALVALSLVVTGLDSWQRFVTVLFEHTNEPGWAAGLAFQTTPSFFQHLFRPDAQWNPQPVWVLPAWVARGGTLLVSALAVGALLWKDRRADRDLAFAAALTLGVVLLPFAEEYHYALLVLPFSVAIGRLAQRPSRWAAVWLGVCLVLLAVPWPYKDPWLNLGWHAFLGYPRLYGGWLLWVWLMAALAPVVAAEAEGPALAPEPAAT